eukprot:TRINITY_DN4053_c0_g1_i2.p1 TRINITY_DN4053_c0_g1~~TRINITY_DN4053_c0_g1_i2.p1  ORF type:complete len:294 (+),score=82.55 TRINITY_DN4053_c0_g1_i2:156-1037(+)
MEGELAELQEIIKNLDEAERTPEVIEWAKEVSKKEFGLVGSLIQGFKVNLTNPEVGNPILRALRKLLEFVPENILPQLKADRMLPGVLVTYITQTPIENFEGAVLVIFSKMFDESSFKGVISERCIEKLFKLLEDIKDDQTFKTIVYILISISSEQAAEENVVIKLCLTHPSRRYFGESMLHIINKGSDQSKGKCMKTLREIYRIAKPDEGFLYHNDLKALIEILIRELRNTPNMTLKDQTLETIQVLVKTKDYQKEKPHSSDIVDLANELIYSDVSDAVRDRAEKLLNSGDL